MVGIGEVLCGDVLCQLLLYLHRCVACWRDESEAMADPVDVCVNGHRSLPECNSEHHVGCLASHAWERKQLVHRMRYHTAVVLLQLARELHQMAGFGVGIANAADIA